MILTVGGTLEGDGFVTLYPNPSTSLFTIESKSIIDRIEVYTVMGQRILVQPAGFKKVDVRLTDVAPGLYFVTIHSGNERMVKKVMMVN